MLFKSVTLERQKGEELEKEKGGRGSGRSLFIYIQNFIITTKWTHYHL
jgi:hypothetical protein